MTKQPIRIDTHGVKKMRGKHEWHMKPAATAIGVTCTSYSAPIRVLLVKLLEENKIAMDDVVEIYANTGTLSFHARTVAEWMDGRALGRKPGTREWLRKGRVKDDDEDDEEEGDE